MTSATGRAGNSRSNRRIAWGIFLLLAGVYALSAGGHTYSSDEEVMLATTRSIVQKGNPALEITKANAGVVRAVTTGRTGGQVGYTSLGQSIAAIPFYVAGAAFAKLVSPHHVDLTERIFVDWTNSFVTAAGVSLVLLVAIALGARRRWAVALALVYGLATMAWPHAKTFFSEPLATTLTLAAVYFAILWRSTWKFRYAAFSGFVAALALSARPSSVVQAPIIGLYVLVVAYAHRKTIPTIARTAGAFSLGALPSIALFFLGNWWRFGSPIELGYPGIAFASPVAGLHGLFLSPGKSIFLYAPVLLAGLLAAPFASRTLRPEIGMLVGLGIINALFFAFYTDWHGDHAWGPRYLIISIPFLVLPIAPLLDRAAWRRALIAAGIVGLTITSLAVLINFNAYVVYAAGQLPTGYKPGTDDPVYWRYTHFHIYWSPILGHARMVPLTLRNTLSVLRGNAEISPFPEGTDNIYAWYLYSPSGVDSWVYWLFAADGPETLLIFIPVFMGTALTGGAMVVRQLRNKLEAEVSSARKEEVPWGERSSSSLP